MRVAGRALQPAAGDDREELLRIREAMIKRGPDGAGLWVSDDGRVVVLLELLGKTNRLSETRGWGARACTRRLRRAPSRDTTPGCVWCRPWV